MAEGSGLENQRRATYRGFESHPLRHTKNAGVRSYRQGHPGVTRKAAGSSPAAPAIYSPVAQLAEHLAVNQRVPGSSPGGGATKLKDYKHNPWDIFMSNKGVKR